MFVVKVRHLSPNLQILLQGARGWGEPQGSRLGSVPGDSAQRTPPFAPWQDPPWRLWLQGAPSSCLVGCTCHGPQPPGVTSGGAQTPVNQSPGQTALPVHSGSRLSTSWGETMGGLSAALGTPPLLSPTATLCVDPSVPHTPVTVTHQREACPRCCGPPARLPAPAAPKTLG